MEEILLRTEFIIQRIQAGDEVEVLLDSKEVISGSVVDDDVVAPRDIMEIKLAIHNVPLPGRKLRLYKRRPDDDIVFKPILDIPMPPLINDPPFEIPISSIVSIKKITQ